MTNLPNTTYVLVGRCLTPSLSEEQREELTDLFSRADICWDRLLSEANRQQCTPLWYVRLKAHRLLDWLPDDLQAYLAELTAANRVRNRLLRGELEHILNIFQSYGIQTILLNGVASFADRLYTDEGARLIDAMDLLVPREQIREAERLLMMEGYIDTPEKNNLGSLQSCIPTLYHLRKSTAVKLHFALKGGPSGNALDTEVTFQEAVSGEIATHPVGWLPPTQRLLHNALHAIQSQGAFLRGNLRLADLAEFSAIRNRYRKDLDLYCFWTQVRARELVPEVATYTHLVNQLTNDAIDPPDHPKIQSHLNRIAAAQLPAFARLKRGERWRNYLWRLRARSYHFIKLPGWTWQNTCGSRRDASKLKNLACFARKMLDPRFIRRALHPQAS